MRGASTVTMTRSLSLVALSFLGFYAEHAQAAARFVANDYRPVDNMDCSGANERYMQIEVFDYNLKPKFEFKWSQLTGECGEFLAEADRKEWTAGWDWEVEEQGQVTENRLQVDLYMCAPHGDYELTLVHNSENGKGGNFELRNLRWEIENGPDEYHIWDTLNTQLNGIEAYTPTKTGTYTWPLEDQKGYYKTMYTGDLPPKHCPNLYPAGIEYIGCFEAGLFGSSPDPTGTHNSKDPAEEERIGPDGMTLEKCKALCSGFEYFGLEWSIKCFCGTKADFEVPTNQGSSSCGSEYKFLCSGDSRVACGADDAISVYRRTDDFENDTPSPTPLLAGSFSEVGCYADLDPPAGERIMTKKASAAQMSADICFGLCNDGANTHFGTQWGRQCWCAASPDLTLNGPELTAANACSQGCFGGDGTEKCGGSYQISAYEMTFASGSTPGPVPVTDPPTPPTPPPTDVDRVGTYEATGCFSDSTRIMVWKASRKELMSASICFGLCNDGTNTHFGTQWGRECWCAASPNLLLNGPELTGASACSTDCPGVRFPEKCGGAHQLSTYVIISGTAPSPAPPYSPMGCFTDALEDVVGTDTVEGRIMGTKMFASEMSAEICFDMCTELGEPFTHFGTQWGRECWCSESPDLTKNGDELAASACNYTCGGADDGEKCGGLNRMSVFGMV